MTAYEQRRLEDWKRQNLSVAQVEKEIKYLEGNLKRDTQRLENMQAYVAEHYVGFNEWVDHRAKKAKSDIEYWNKAIAFEKWLLEQPQYNYAGGNHER